MPDVWDDINAALGTASPRKATTNYDDLINDSATRHGIDPDLIRAQIGQESQFKRGAVSPKGASGLMQLMPGTAKRFGVTNIFDPQQNIEGGTKYMKFLLDRYHGDVGKALAGYNAGEGAVDKYGDIPPYKETQNYVKKIQGNYKGSGYLNSGDDIWNSIGKVVGPTPSDGSDVWDQINSAIGQPPSKIITNPAQTMVGNTPPVAATQPPVAPQTALPPTTAPTATPTPQFPNLLPQTPPTPVPEAPETIQAQVMSMSDAKSPRSAVLVTDPSQMSLLNNVSGLTQVKLPEGTLFVNGRKLNMKPPQVQQYVKQNGFAGLIGKVEDVGNNTGPGTMALASTDAQGNELASSVVSNPETAQAQAKADQAQFPQVANQQIVPSQAVVAKRLQGRAVPPQQQQPPARLAQPSALTTPTEDDVQAYLKDQKLPDTPENRQKFTDALASAGAGQTSVNAKLITPRAPTKASDIVPANVGDPRLQVVGKIPTNEAGVPVTQGSVPIRVDLTGLPDEQRTDYAIASVQKGLQQKYNITADQAQKIANRITQGPITKATVTDQPTISVPLTAFESVMGKDWVLSNLRKQETEAAVQNPGMNIRPVAGSEASTVTPSTPKEIAYQQQERDLKPPTDDEYRQRAIDELTEQQRTEGLNRFDREGTSTPGQNISENEIKNKIAEYKSQELPYAAKLWAYQTAKNLPGPVAGLAEGAGSLFHTAAAFARPFSNVLANNVARFGTALQTTGAMQKDKNGEDVMNDIVKGGFAMIPQFAELAAGGAVLKSMEIPNGGIALFGFLSGAKAYGQGQSTTKVAQETTSGMLQGAAFEAPINNAYLKLGTVAGVTAATNAAQGMPIGENLQSTIVNTLFAAHQKFGEAVEGKNYRFWQEGKPFDVTVDKKGEIGLTKGVGGNVAGEIVLDPQNPVYKMEPQGMRQQSFEPNAPRTTETLKPEVSESQSPVEQKALETNQPSESKNEDNVPPVGKPLAPPAETVAAQVQTQPNEPSASEPNANEPERRTSPEIRKEADGLYQKFLDIPASDKDAMAKFYAEDVKKATPEAANAFDQMKARGLEGKNPVPNEEEVQSQPKGAEGKQTEQTQESKEPSTPEASQPNETKPEFRAGDRVQDSTGRKGVIEAKADGTQFVRQDKTQASIPLSEKWNKTPQQIKIDKAEAKAQAKSSGEAGFVSSSILTAPARMIRAVHRFISVEPTPALKRAGLAAEARQHAAARISVPHVVNDLLAKVFPNSYTQPEEMAKTVDIINKDNILDGYNTFLQKEADARKAGDDKTADMWRKRAENVGSPADIAKLYQEVSDAKNDPDIVANIERWKQHINPEMDTLFNKMKGIDPNTPRDGRGLLFGARINLLTKAKEAEMSSFSDTQKPMPESVTSNYRNPNAKHDPFDRAAKFTGDYSTDAHSVLANVLGTRLNETTKLDFYKAIEAKGAGVMLSPGEKPPAEINNQKAVRLAVKVPETDAEGNTRQVEKSLYVQQDIAREVRDALNTDSRLTSNPVGKFLTQIQLAQLADMSAHLKNIHTVLANAPSTKGVFGQIAKKFPGVGTVDAFKNIATISKDVISDTPQIRAEMAQMAKNGLIRPEYPSTGIQKFTRGQQLIHAVDTSARITMNRFFDKLVAAGRVTDTPENRMSFVQQIGEYNDRLMSPLMRAAKQSGLSPFVVAGRNFNRQGMRLLTGHPGVEAASNTEAAKFRMGNLVGGMVAVGVTPAILNVLSTGSMGGRPGTPIGAWDLGQPEDDKGKHRVVDIAQILGYRRGLRATGIDATIAGLREGASGNEILGKAVSDVTSTAAHPWMGPALGFTYQGLTGQRLDLRGGATPEEARNVGGGIRQYGEQFRVALKNQNPLLYNALSPVIGTQDENEEKSYGQRLLSGTFKSPATAVGISDVQSPAIKLMRDIQNRKGQMITTPEKAESKATAKTLIEKARSGQDVDEELGKALQQGVVSMKQVKDLAKNANLSPLALGVKYLELPDALQVYERATPEQRRTLQGLVIKKALNAAKSGKITNADRQAIGRVHLVPPQAAAK